MVHELIKQGHPEAARKVGGRPGSGPVVSHPTATTLPAARIAAGARPDLHAMHHCSQLPVLFPSGCWNPGDCP